MAPGSNPMMAQRQCEAKAKVQRLARPQLEARAR